MEKSDVACLPTKELILLSKMLDVDIHIDLRTVRDDLRPELIESIWYKICYGMDSIVPQRRMDNLKRKLERSSKKRIPNKYEIFDWIAASVKHQRMVPLSDMVDGLTTRFADTQKKKMGKKAAGALCNEFVTYYACSVGVVCTWVKMKPSGREKWLVYRVSGLLTAGNLLGMKSV